MRIVINFKNTPEDIRLYEELKKHSSISGYVKDVLRGIIVNSNDNQFIKDDDISEDIEDIIGD